MGMESPSRLAVADGEWIEAALHSGAPERLPQWSESLAVGGREFVEGVGRALGVRAQHRQIETCGAFSVLRDPGTPYRRYSGSEIVPISCE